VLNGLEPSAINRPTRSSRQQQQFRPKGDELSESWRRIDAKRQCQPQGKPRSLVGCGSRGTAPHNLICEGTNPCHDAPFPPLRIPNAAVFRRPRRTTPSGQRTSRSPLLARPLVHLHDRPFDLRPAPPVPRLVAAPSTPHHCCLAPSSRPRA
jgi:hypothetical protein